ncbi:hypothetical protein M501DRAFT_1054974 [Patellaria atrata CBS 101060]|uniref:BTB domain-containing protein n=1 Tax=Patellaria atrata CBS 101060 TaxID=1346257 RepID=A0A9P4SH29_9PEZI|nr:hypothetical protein M501DRAFT_1054974 [Patellaria atrata CBS 101060]
MTSKIATVKDGGEDGKVVKKQRLTLKERSRLGSSGVVILVGKRLDSKYLIHESILTKTSLFFRSAMKKEWKEGEEKIVRFNDVSSETFDLYQCWLYTNAVYTSERDPSGTSFYSFLINAYLFGDRILDHPFKDIMMDTFSQKMEENSKIPVSLTYSIYYGTAPSSPLRRIMVDKCTYSDFSESLDRQTADDLPKDFLMGLVRSLSKKTWGRLPGIPPWDSNSNCYYHSHGTEFPCYKTLDWGEPTSDCRLVNSSM